MALAPLPRPSRPPPAEMLSLPIWTTWARYKAGVTQAATEKFGAEIASRGHERCIMEIDDRWQARRRRFSGLFAPLRACLPVLFRSLLLPAPALTPYPE